MLTLIAVISVVVTTLFLSVLTNRYFRAYMRDSYATHYNQIVEYITDTLKSNNISPQQIAVNLETHLVDPITRIKVYDNNGNLIADVSADADTYSGRKMMKGMMRGMMGRIADSRLEEVDHAEIKDGTTVLGEINITRYSSAENSFAAWMFQSALIRNSFISIGIVLVLSVIVGVLVSRRMSRDLVQTSQLAQNIEIGNEAAIQPSNVREIRVIQQSLESLKSRLLLRQKSRKTLIDELIHQTRTPLTILRTHLEGIEDGVIEMEPEEIKICENQIENITAIISNMSNLIDAEKPEGSLRIEEFELSHLLRQIVSGLKVQFDKKNIDLKIAEQEKVIIRTDRYKLSQVIYNVLTNAYKFTGPNGRVSLSYRTDTNQVILSIEDNGPGISREDQARIFDAYFKKDTVTGAAGDGIGMYIARENMAGINGSITVESEINKGSRFILTIPR
jgi:signal transduction histidine kinase